MNRVLTAVIALLLTGCGGFKAVDYEPDNPVDNIVVKATYYITVGESSAYSDIQYSTSNNSVTVVVSPDTTFTIDDTAFNSNLTVGSVNTIDLGLLTITDLSDNDLKQCPSAPGSKCNTGVIRSYTTGTPGSGLWNSTDSYGLPISGGLSGSEANIGLDTPDAYDMFTFSLNGNKTNFSDLNGNVDYGYIVDSSDAGAGSYSTTLIIEYGITYVP